MPRSSRSSSAYSSSSTDSRRSGRIHRRSVVVASKGGIFYFIDPEEVASCHLSTKKPRDESTSADEPAAKRFTVGRSRSKKFRNYMLLCLQPSDARSIRKRYEPDFLKKSGSLQCPNIDHSMARRMKERKGPEISDACNDTLRLLGHAFASLTAKRQENILKFTNTRFEFLLKDPKRFDSDECDELFGRLFLRSMMRDADNDARLRNVNRPNSSGQRGSSNSSHHPGRGNGRQSSSSFSSGPNRGGSNNNFHGRRYVESLVPVTVDSIRIGGHVRFSANFWSTLTNDQLVVRSVSEGDAVLNNGAARGPWTSHDLGRHINELELLAALHALESFAGRASKSACLNDISQRIISLCEIQSFSLHAVYLPEALNREANFQSRAHLDASDWRLDPTVFSRISCQWVLSIDLFASAWNRDLEIFVSWHPQPAAHAIDAFSLDWHHLQAYAFPPFSLIRRGLGKIRKDQAELTLVAPYWPTQPWFPSLLELACERPLLIPHEEGPSSRPGWTPTPSPVERRATSDRLAVIRSRYETRDLQEGVIKYLRAADRPSTSATYQSALSAWVDWSIQRVQNPLSPTLNGVLSFLCGLAESGKAYWTVNVYRSMLSVTVGEIEGFDVGKHLLVVRLMKGIFSSNPPSAKYSGFWDINVVIAYLESLCPNTCLPFKHLSLELPTPLALSSLCRVSELVAIDFDSITVSDIGVKFALSKLRKNQHRGPLKSFTLKRMDAESLSCPVACMSTYLIRSYDFRSQVYGNRLLLGLKPPHKSVGASTVARWIKEILASAEINTKMFSAHSTKGAAASKAFAAGIPVERILKAGGWAAESVFFKALSRPGEADHLYKAILVETRTASTVEMASNPESGTVTEKFFVFVT
ncbi:Uncharacterized protein APZ42_030056 [Daphnia magna]|uniref:Tyr recombinase domain-containing protein n=1 Tax=Daphnia magna TaxID=35525 RepID=A0A164P3B3_9CRUS|nr:Uncharacterized protein APZ42_030056 [Daphnia magna]